MTFGQARNSDAPDIQVADVAEETEEAAALRHERVAKRRSGIEIICHRGALEFAHENTLEAYRATFELGADGNEIDIRATRDGVLVCFHDDMLDRLLDAYGTVREATWDELRGFQFREPGAFGAACRIPALVEVFELHRQHAGLLHLDIKESGLDTAIAELIDRMDMWDHIAYCNSETAPAIIRHPKLRLSNYKAGLYEDRGEADPIAIADVLQRPGNGVILEDPRGVLVALGRPIGKVSRQPVAPLAAPQENSATRPTRPSIEQLIATLRDADDWQQVAQSADEQASSGKRIRERARAAEDLLAAHTSSIEAFAALEQRVRDRSLHKDWMYHGFDSAMALRSLIRLGAPQAVEVARHVLWLNDPALAAVYNPEWKTPTSWSDFRVKMHVFPSLSTLPGPDTEQLCRDYLALSDEAAREIGPPQFEEAARTLLAISPAKDTALELLRHRLRVVRGRAVLACLAHIDEPWAREALEQERPHALALLSE
jgi:hypothetical protein